MWTSLIQYADYVWLACRTDPEAPRHKGLSILIVPTSAAGFSWTPVHTVAGTDHQRHLLLRRAGARLRPGRRAEPGLAADHQPAQPRAGRAHLGGAGPSALRAVCEWASATKLATGQRVIDQEWVQLNLARVHAKADFLKLINWRIAAEAGQGLGPAAASATKVFGTEFATEAYRLLMEVLGANAHVREGSPGPCWRAGSSGCTGRADPDLRRRHQRGAARHHRRRRPGAARCPPLRAGTHGFFPHDSQQELSALTRRDPHRPGHARTGSARSRPAVTGSIPHCGPTWPRPASWPPGCPSRWAGPDWACSSSAQSWPRSAGRWLRCPTWPRSCSGAGALARFGTAGSAAPRGPAGRAAARSS